MRRGGLLNSSSDLERTKSGWRGSSEGWRRRRNQNFIFPADSGGGGKEGGSAPLLLCLAGNSLLGRPKRASRNGVGKGDIIIMFVLICIPGGAFFLDKRDPEYPPKRMKRDPHNIIRKLLSSPLSSSSPSRVE